MTVSVSFDEAQIQHTCPVKIMWNEKQHALSYSLCPVIHGHGFKHNIRKFYFVCLFELRFKFPVKNVSFM